MPIIRKSVFASLIIEQFPINQERTSAVHFSITETALISEWIEQSNVEEAGDVESK